uniref:Uncharacterized protein n=1 Tax=viral metagenome TaxID=1070528 RepID=A0A6C0ITU6_9ZZZZ
MSQQGGKVNKSLKAWVAFVKKVQREEKLSYKDAIHRAKVRKDKGEKWMSGGAVPTTPGESTSNEETIDETVEITPDSEVFSEEVSGSDGQNIAGGRRTRRRSKSRSRGRGRGRTARRSRSARRSRGRGRARY